MKEVIKMKNTYKPGAVSLFIVVFSALLMTVVTISFITLMVANQQQATSDDLSQSALDSAQAGVEDAKRALLQYESLCVTGVRSDKCDAIEAAMTKCNAVFGAPLNLVGTSASNAVQVGGSTGDASYSQAYTCVKIDLDSGDYLGEVAADGSAYIPLQSVGPFDTIQISWTSQKDLSDGSGYDVDLANPSAIPPLLKSWPVNRPSVMRTQLIQIDSTNGFTLGQFDDTSNGQTDNSTVFLYPTGITGVKGGGSPVQSLFTARKTSAGTTGVTPMNVRCSGDLEDGGYSCTQRLSVPAAIGGGDALSFIRLTALYNGAHYQVRLLNGTTPVDFHGVQPQIDSTGRANDLYRRIATRVVVIDGSFPYPDGAVEATGSICKDFVITDTAPDVDSCSE